MSLSYFRNKAWSEISREESFFCQALFQYIKGRESEFVSFLKKVTTLKLDEKMEWEVGYEVCFYRDMLRIMDKTFDSGNYSKKRTFDLCLFSEDVIIVIEAKVQQPFKKEQIEYIEKDKYLIPKFLQREGSLEVKTIALASSTYYDNHKNFGHQELLKPFDAKISWVDVFSGFHQDRVFSRANDIYKK